MPTFVTLIRFTEQGASNFKDTVKRAAAFKDAAGAEGVTVREQLWTLGKFDGVLVLEAPNLQAVTAVMLNLSALGNVRTQTLPAFDESEMGEVISRAGGGGATSGKAGGASSAGGGGASGGAGGRSGKRGR